MSGNEFSGIQNSRTIDFHCHHVPSRFELTAIHTQPAFQRARWETLAKVLPDETLLMRHVREGQLGGRVVNIPGNLLADPYGFLPAETYRAMNNELADLVARHGPSVIGLASVDGYDGDVSAKELERAVQELGLSGVFIDCARGNFLLDCEQARPTLQVADRLGIPVFAHPVAAQPLTDQMTPYGVIGTLFARGSVNSACLIAFVEGGIFEEFPDLRVVFTAQALGGLVMETGLSAQSKMPKGALEVLRRNVFIDTTLSHPILLRTMVDILGSDHVLAGSDWPIAGDTPFSSMLASAMNGASLTSEEQRKVSSQNALQLLKRVHVDFVGAA